MDVIASDDPLLRASLQDRVFAFLVDAAITALGISLALIGTAQNNAEGDKSGATTVFFFYLSVTVLLIPIGMALGGTLGQRIVGLRIRTLSTGGRPGLVRGFVRWFVAIVSAVLLFAGYWPLFKGKEGWHDRIAGTMVVHVKDSRGAVPPSFWS
jgi:uncharacterized RDD family membrane protein YckC